MHAEHKEEQTWSHRMVHELAQRPVIYDALRWLLEAGYHGERAVLNRERIAEAKFVLDLGCGTGALAQMCPAPRYVGIDPNARYIHRAQERHPQRRFCLMNGTALGFTSGTFDVVVISGVVHHLSDGDGRALLREARRVLNPQTGRLVMWEDVAARSRWNVVGRLVHRLDEGEHIRSSQAYSGLVRSVFGNARSYGMTSGICDYVVVTAEVRPRSSAAPAMDRTAGVGAVSR